MKIVVACPLPEDALDELRGLALDVVYLPDATGASLRERVADASILVVANTRVAPDVITRGRGLQLIIEAGHGPGDIAADAASEQGIFVSHCPGKHADAVAELVMGLVLALDRRIVDHTLALREGRWMPSDHLDARGLAGRTLGILGYDVVGRALARRARAFDMRVVAWSPRSASETPAEPGVEVCNWPRELARMSDCVAVLNVDQAQPELLIDAEFLAAMAEGGILVHLGQPGLVDEVALAEAVQTRGLRLAVDVYGPGPMPEVGRMRCRLCDLAGVIGTQASAAATEQSRRAIANEVVRIVRAFIVSGEVLNCVNICERSPATWQLVLRVRDQVGVMASILETIRADGINAEEIASRVFMGAHAAWCTIALDERPSREAVENIRSLPDVLHLELRAVV